MNETRNQGPSRRSLLITTAWATPAIVVAAAAPAMATSGASYTFVTALTPATATATRNTRVNSNLTIQNTSNTTFTGSIPVTISGMYNHSTTDFVDVGNDNASGWSYTSGSSFSQLTFTWSGTLAPQGTTVALPLSADERGSTYPHTVQLTAASSNSSVAPTAWMITWT